MVVVSGMMFFIDVTARSHGKSLSIPIMLLLMIVAVIIVVTVVVFVVFGIGSPQQSNTKTFENPQNFKSLPLEILSIYTCV